MDRAGRHGAIALAGAATAHGGPVNANCVTAAASVSLIAYRFYSRFIADRVLRLDLAKPTLAVRHAVRFEFVPAKLECEPHSSLETMSP